MIIKRHLGLVLVTLLLAGCAGFNNAKKASGKDIGEDEKNPDEGMPLLREYHLPEDMVFLPASFSWPAVAPGVGVITREQNDPGVGLSEQEKETLAESFRTAYIEGQLRQSSLEGVLGGDFVHSWPPAAPLSWVQNWRDRSSSLNTWGIPSLVLAVRGIKGNVVFIVRGVILNMYGRSRGINGANGVAGYGAPRSEEFLYNGGIAQYFDYGLIHVDVAGTEAFIPHKLPVSEEETPIPGAVGYFTGNDRAIRDDFQKAWQRGIHSNLQGLNPDGPVQRIDFSEKPWEIPADSGTVHIDALYFQSFNQGGGLFLLARSRDAPFQTRIIAGPFLNAFLAGKDNPLPGTSSPSIPKAVSPGGFTGALLQGLGFYGIPLTDAYPAPEGGTYRETQRFSRGWMGYTPILPSTSAASFSILMDLKISAERR
ncbi:MAG: hypothetical protein LBP74_06190 [Treponema sp.]|jgi:hypothetical protein|nr:hypothetical protein [Treponema sp.]